MPGAFGLWPCPRTPPKKTGLVPQLLVRWGEERIPQSETQSWFCLSEPLPRAVIFLIVKLRRGFSQLSFVYVLFALNIFLITYFCVVSSFEPPLDRKTFVFDFKSISIVKSIATYVLTYLSTLMSLSHQY